MGQIRNILKALILFYSDGSTEIEAVVKVDKKKKGIWMLELPPMNSNTICSVFIHYDGTFLIYQQETVDIINPFYDRDYSDTQ